MSKSLWQRNLSKRSSSVGSDLLDQVKVKQLTKTLHLNIPPGRMPVPKASKIKRSRLGTSNTIEILHIIESDAQEAPIDERWPSTRLGFIISTHAELNLTYLNHLAKTDPLDPLEVKEAVDPDVQTLILPSVNVGRTGETTLNRSWRKSLTEQLNAHTYAGFSPDDMIKLLKPGKKAGTVQIDKCPEPGCDYPGYKIALPGKKAQKKKLQITTNNVVCGGRTCTAHHYFIDGLLSHRELQEEGSNKNTLTRLANSIKHLHAAAWAEKVGKLDSTEIQSTAIIVNGSLSLNGFSAASLLDGLRKLYGQPTTNQPAPLLIGILEHGPFVDYAEGIKDQLNPGELLEITPALLKTYIIHTSAAEWGKDTHYGYPFIYKTREGAMIAFMLPRNRSSPDSYRYDDYPQLATVVDLLERISSSNYPGNTMLPVFLSHYAQTKTSHIDTVLNEIGKEVLRA